MNASLGSITFITALLLPVSVLAQQPVTRLGCLSPHRAFTESAEGKSGIARLQAIEEQQTREIAAKNKTLQAQEQALEQNGSVLAPEARARQTREVEKFRVDLQRFIQEAQAELVGVQHEIENAFLANPRPAVEKVAKARQLQVVVNLDADGVVWADPAIDITPDVVKQLAAAEPPKK